MLRTLQQEAMLMYREITLLEDTRCFQRDGQSNALEFKGVWRHKGDTLTVGPLEHLEYDHRPQAVVSFTFNDQTYYMLVSELNIPELASTEMVSDE